MHRLARERPAGGTNPGGTMRRLHPLLGVALAVALLGCEESATVEILEGRDFDPVRLVAIHRGQTTRDEVLEIFGEPWRRAGPPENEEWEYFARFRRTPARTLGLIPSGRVEEYSRRMVIHFKGDFVDRVEQASTQPGEE